MLRGFRYRLYPTPEQERLLAQHFGSCRFVYNHFLSLRQTSYRETGTSPSTNECMSQLTILKQEKPWLYAVNAQALQQALHHLDAAYQRFFRKLGNYPRFKTRHAGWHSFLVPQAFRIDQHHLVLPKFREGIRLVLHRPLGGIPKSVTITRTPSGKTSASVLCEVPDPVHPTPTSTPMACTGVDVGLTSLAVTSTGIVVPGGRFLRTQLGRLRRLQRAVSRKHTGSRNRGKANQQVARLHEYIASQRENLLHQVSRRIVDESQVPVLEDLHVTGMLRNHCLALSLSDAGLAALRRLIWYKAAAVGKPVLLADRFFPSSKRCRRCHRVNHTLTLAERHWTCVVCGAVHDRDRNAADNLEDHGIAGHARTASAVPKERLPSARSRWGAGRAARRPAVRDSVHLAGSVKQEAVPTGLQG
jgi:putative transposase